jgi:pantothenate kinase
MNKSEIISLRDEIILDISNESPFKYRQENMCHQDDQVIEFREDSENERFRCNIKIVMSARGNYAYYRFFSSLTGKVKIDWIRLNETVDDAIIKESKDYIISKINSIFDDILLDN